MAIKAYTDQKEELESYFRRFGLGGETAFHAIAYQYYLNYSDRLGNISNLIISKWYESYQKIKYEKHIIDFLNKIVSKDLTGDKLSEWYQFLIGRKFRKASGKFFTPQQIAEAMASMLPRREQSVIMDPTCGSGTFLMEAVKFWENNTCTLVANDIETSLVELAMITLNLATHFNHKNFFINTDIYKPSKLLINWYGKIDYILANPPFSLRINYEQFDSPLFMSGYLNSDALFIDVALKLLRPGGRLVCLLPHSVVVNKEFSTFRNIVEKSWTVLGVICLPEGVFNLSAGTTTRADIVIMEKSNGNSSARKHLFASVPSVGIKLNGNDMDLACFQQS